ncbi:2,3,4,5-tetrahydropyridine-2,6-dicarboxylate N-acetyltransferase [Clostridium luticellarii]|jgi:2,3,4,5-tetrahydropyridine-2-carboxylate N-succinyltransferase|uniref:2,3,4,5-tetrahydropyridine-2,6-dicarboxylate N-acetyltransferase n=1 Tax=Clostridium luticellarii TaxID=1691940 RepID=A0A2T0BBX1_9CLOT|nr:2,3,4,5-tetrahydropyridine-2,6-dicarboxylate N-acetyltransferase [Clostridium luticellarii]MCI1944492.1 2,3,4,5-tetrahydropyridine-2,6-dicarboxylate N-acetyltransferase [Clostridium luticellarii]MCI1967991.1 2,3,4,5-tetrahydropyridine-2,6-dicarboxylate N-acetyltransferase [Clostridium luticellarii]MCI1995070.1 2,3,4,5-tetrahydropyridine-2,6-dicarboxylate N-acetyltransferase [Clostridium luticellarii]MCI2039229.1 2,3,4,5-tetrahydropyridine-2,6-dicarboxylate N-acetyltransferase [Clostridium lu
MESKYDLTDPYQIAKYIKEAKKSTPVKLYVQGNISEYSSEGVEIYGSGDFHIIFGESDEIAKFLKENGGKIDHFRMEQDRRNSAIPLIDLISIDARIEPGAIIRDRVKIDKNAVVMMGAVINIGAEIGEGTMVDMNAVVGARGKLGKNVHLGAGAVVAGVLEPPSKSPCQIGDDVLIGANSVILEGVKIGNGSVIAAGSVVIEDIPAGVVAAGTPAKVIKKVDDSTKDKTKILADLRK